MKDDQELHVIPCWVWGESLPIHLLSGLSCLLDQVEHKLGRGEPGRLLLVLCVPADHPSPNPTGDHMKFLVILHMSLLFPWLVKAPHTLPPKADTLDNSKTTV